MQSHFVIPATEPELSEVLRFLGLIFICYHNYLIRCHPGHRAGIHPVFNVFGNHNLNATCLSTTAKMDPGSAAGMTKFALLLILNSKKNNKSYPQK